MIWFDYFISSVYYIEIINLNYYWKYICIVYMYMMMLFVKYKELVLKFDFLKIKIYV